MELLSSNNPFPGPLSFPEPLKPGGVLLLASASPRRAALLQAVGVPFEVCAVDIDEHALEEELRAEQPDFTPAELVKRLAIAKAFALAARSRGRLVLGADTVVALENRILGKPRDMEDARRTLRELSGRVNHVYTGVAFARAGGGVHCDVCCTEVQFKKLSDADIEEYLRLVNPLDKAGSYAIQEHGDLIIEAVRGSVSNVIGLPLELALRCLPGGLLEPNTRRHQELLGWILAFLLLLFGWPLLLLTALLVKCSSRGAVLYASKRLGQYGKPIHVLKFRTMRENADAHLEQILSESPQKAREWAEKNKLQNDPRITAVGHFLRHTSLDELPQLWNVLRGDMTFIGPRPIVPEEIPKYGSAYELLAQVKPGMTGLWQVSGRSTLSYARRVALDMQYIRERTLVLDAKILWHTLPEVLRGRGAW
ncbi:MAG: septum formation protein Maf [Victivallales bacterium]|nr:septum formation protein Maf [Victivallales bacterium]